MNTTPVTDALATPAPDKTLSNTSRLVRRVHMFAGLFLAPWMLMYALSTLVMTHRQFVASFYASKNPEMVTERELDYSRSFPANATREQIADQILQDLELTGTHYLSGGKNGQPLVIHRQHPLSMHQITFEVSKQKIVLQREKFRALTFLERMHRRRGYNSYPLENTWGFLVDVAVVTMVFWCLSGVWLWWELKSTRRWGALSLTAGLALFVMFLVLI